MNSFPKSNIDIMGGVNAFAYVEQQGIENTTGTCATLKTNYEWLDGYSHFPATKLEIKPVKTDHGLHYESVLKGTYPGNSVEMAELMHEMQNLRFALLAMDNDNMMYLVQDMKFTADFTTDNVNGNKQWSFSFVGKSYNRPCHS
jgi:hypothetical protein